jgi:hypothetical protein
MIPWARCRGVLCLLAVTGLWGCTRAGFVAGGASDSSLPGDVGGVEMVSSVDQGADSAGLLDLATDGGDLPVATKLLFDRGLPNTNLNNAAGESRCNVCWSLGPTAMTGDDFMLPAGKTYQVTTLRIWIVPVFNKTEPPTLGDWYESVALYAGKAGSPSMAVLSSSAWSPGNDQPDTPSIQVKKVDYPQNPGSKYQGTAGDFYQVYEVAFTDLQWQVPGGTKYWFGVRGVSRGLNDYPWMNHASNGPLSGSPQDGADDYYLVFDTGGKLLQSIDSSTNGWDKSSNINVQIEGY